MTWRRIWHVVTVGDGSMIDFTGRPIATQTPRPQQFHATLDLDRTIIHENFNEEKVAELLKRHAGEVELEQRFAREAWYLLRATAPGVRVRDLCRKYQIETLREYRQRSRRQINEARTAGKRV